METVRIGKYDVNKDDVYLYIDHFRNDKTEIFVWERMRKKLHDNVFEKLGLDRFSDEGQEFSDEFDKFCEPKILKFDRLTATLKKFSRSRTDEEMASRALELGKVLHDINYKELSGFRDKPLISNRCRICKKDLSGGGGRVNDHMAVISGFDEIDEPICKDCSDNKPDEYHIAFKKQYWKR